MHLITFRRAKLTSEKSNLTGEKKNGEIDRSLEYERKPFLWELVQGKILNVPFYISMISRTVNFFKIHTNFPTKNPILHNRESFRNEFLSFESSQQGNSFDTTEALQRREYATSRAHVSAYEIP